MPPSTILLFGASGQVGQALKHHALPSHWQLKPVSHAECDITDRRAVQKVMQTAKPDLVINLAAMTAVDQCEKDYDKAMAVNFEGASNIATQCSFIDAPLIHISTDYVFDGKDGATPYTTENKMSPLNVYGHSKMMGEEAIRHELMWHVILRISSVFSAFGDNLLTRALKNIDTRDEIKSVTDQIACPTPAPDVAAAIITIGNALLSGKGNGFGTFHLCGTPAATRFEFMQAIMEAYEPFTDKRPAILPAITSDFPGFAERPAYSVLDCSKIKTVYGIEQKPWRDGLVEAVQRLEKAQ